MVPSHRRQLCLLRLALALLTAGAGCADKAACTDSSCQDGAPTNDAGSRSDSGSGQDGSGHDGSGHDGLFVSTNRFGIVIDGIGDSAQWDSARNLVGDHGHLSLIMLGIAAEMTSVPQDWIDAIQGTYERNLIAVVRVGPKLDDRRIRDDADDAAASSYTTLAAKYRLVVEALLPKVKANWPIYFQIHNEPNLGPEWACDPADLETMDAEQAAREYAAFLRDVAAALHAIGDPRVKVMNAGLSPGGWAEWACGDELDNSGVVLSTEFLAKMVAAVPKLGDSLDAWASHAYPGSTVGKADGPTYNAAVPSLKLFHDELAVLGKQLPVVVTESGWFLGSSGGSTREAIATQTVAAWKGVWLTDPLIVAVTPFMFHGVGDWGAKWWWVESDLTPLPVYTATRALRCQLGIPARCE